MGGTALNQGVLEGDNAPGQVRARTFGGVDDEGWPGGSEAWLSFSTSPCTSG